jgi:hypothetical protein
MFPDTADAALRRMLSDFCCAFTHVPLTFRVRVPALFGPHLLSRATAILAPPPPSTSGLGRHPFKVVARVRIPLGA